MRTERVWGTVTRLLLAAVVCCALTAGVRADSDIADLESIENAFVALAQQVTPSVVAISTKNNRGAWARDRGERKTPMVGSGVIIDADGLILTNDHVVRSGDRVYATLANGRRYRAKIVAYDERSDLAVISIKAHDLVPADFGDLAEVRVGQFALAMGNPFGSAKDGNPSLSYGIVSALGKSLRELEEGDKRYYGNLIQTTADINPGNSGGPLFNIRGQVIGINTAIETRSGVSEGLGYAIPISRRTRHIIDTLADGAQVQYGFLGVNIETDERARRRVVGDNPWGVVITRVFQNSPAALAGLRKNDLILRFESELIKNQDHLIRMVGATPVGETVRLLILRGDREMIVRATVGERVVSLASGSE